MGITAPANAVIQSAAASPERTLRAPALAVLGLLAVAATACTSASAQQQATQRPEEQEIGLLFAPTAKGGTMEPIEGTSRLELTLNGVTPQVVWFSDRPSRQSGHIPIAEFVDAWEGYGFVEDPPNAALSVLSADESQDTVVVELGPPELDEKGDTIRFPAELREEATGNLSDLASDVDQSVEASFGPVSLFIDDATAKVAAGCVLQSHSRCRDADLRGRDLTGFDLSYSDLTRSNLSGVNFRGANLGATNFSSAQMQNANFDSAYMQQVNLRWANLRGATNLDWRNGLYEGGLFCKTTMPDGSTRDGNCPAS